MLGHDAQRTGRSPYVGPSEPKELWKLSLGSEFSHMSSSPCIGPDGTVYVGTEQGLVAVEQRGRRSWTFHTDGVVVSSPAVAADGTIYAGTERGNSAGGLYAVAANGTEKWHVQLGAWVQSSPVIGPDGMIYVCNSAGSLFAFAADGRQKWRFDGEGAIWLSSPTLGPTGTIYYGTNQEGGPGLLYAVASDGTPLWRLAAGDGMNHPPAVGADGTIYICGERDGRLRAISPRGELLWEFEAGDPIESTPAIAKDGIIVFSSNENTFAVDADGRELWRVNAGAQTSPAIDAHGTVYILSDELIAISREGVVKWSVAKDDYSETSPAIGARGVIYMAGERTLRAVGSNR